MDFEQLITQVADKEIQWVGQEHVKGTPAEAMYIECVRRIQEWTFELMAAEILTLPENDAFDEGFDQMLSTLFERLAQGVAKVDSVNLYMGEPGP